MIQKKPFSLVGAAPNKNLASLASEIFTCLPAGRDLAPAILAQKDFLDKVKVVGL